MDNIYIEYNFTVNPKEPAIEILIAELGSVGFESFVENENGVTGYIQKKDWNTAILEEVFILKSDEFSIAYKQNEVAQTNWNAEWEKNFQPIQVDDIVSIRAPFHENPNLKYDIVIEPKMSFGTGHHETTHMMIQFILDSDIQNKTVLDMGCGTGVLAILAEMKEASNIEAIDIDEWCYLNSIENIERNSCHNIKVLKGDASILKAKKFDIIFANINRNILIKDIPIYASCLNPNGLLFLSGFYKNDIPMIQDVCADYSLNLEAQISKNDWVALKFKIN